MDSNAKETERTSAAYPLLPKQARARGLSLQDGTWQRLAITQSLIELGGRILQNSRLQMGRSKSPTN